MTCGILCNEVFIIPEVCVLAKGKKAGKKLAVGIFPIDEELANLPEEELEHEKEKIFLQLQALMDKEGFKINKEFVAVHKDEEKPVFKAKFCKNGYSMRTIKNFPGWGVIIYYQRYRTRQEHKIRGIEKTTVFEEVIPQKNSYEEAMSELARRLYADGFSVSQIIQAFSVQKGWKVSQAAVRTWVSKVGRKDKKIDFDIDPIYKEIVKAQKDAAFEKMINQQKRTKKK